MLAGPPCWTVGYEYTALLLTLPWPPEPPGASKNEPLHLSKRRWEKCNCDLILGSSWNVPIHCSDVGGGGSEARTLLMNGKERNGSLKEYQAPFKGPFTMWHFINYFKYNLEYNQQFLSASSLHAHLFPRLFSEEKILGKAAFPSILLKLQEAEIMASMTS